ncbi:hypothetical protein [Rhizobium sp.]|uniref:hypothetical protein n=1 Tax=Rhizobium sp. TaxID=391 RepID=UPI0034C6A7E7
MSLIPVALMILAAASSDPCEDMKEGRPVQTISAEAFSLGMQDATPGPKSEYETTAAYEARSNQKLQAFLSKNPYIAFRKEIIGNLAFRYNADTQQLNYEQSSELRCIRDRNKQCVNIHLASSPTTSTLKSYDVSFTPPSDDYTPYPTITASPEQARSIREGDIMLYGSVELIMVVIPEAPYLIKEFRSMTSGRNRYYEGNTLPVRLLCTGWSIKAKR